MSRTTAWTPWHDRLHRTLRQRLLLQKQQRVLLAVSGGQDSLSLSRLMVDLQAKWGWELAIAHCNHRWRPDADGNAAHVEFLTASWNLPFLSATATTSLPSEAAAREWRYAQLTEMAQNYSYTTVLTGHTASDRAETLLYNLFRGSGMDGLQSLSWQRELIVGVQLVRPLLEFTRTETSQICQEFQLPIWQDATNLDLSYARNRIRQEVLPQLKTHFNPQVEFTLAQTAELLQADVAFLERAADEVYGRSIAVDGAIDRSMLREVAIALQRRVLRRFLQTHLAIAPTFADIEKLRNLVAAANHSQTDPFTGGAIASVEGNWIRMQKP